MHRLNWIYVDIAQCEAKCCLLLHFYTDCKNLASSDGHFKSAGGPHAARRLWVGQHWPKRWENIVNKMRYRAVLD